MIVAPHIHYLSLINSYKPSTLLDVSSLTEANLDISIGTREARLCQTMAIGMLAKSRNVERLNLGPTFLKILSLAELRGAPFPTLNVQTLIIKTEFVRSIIPGIARLLLTSPGLKTLTVDTMELHLHKRDTYLEHYSDSQGLSPHRCWRSEYEVFPTSKEIYTMLGCNHATSKLLASFMEFVLGNAKTLERMVICLGGIYLNDDEQWFEELLQLVGTLSHHNNVSIVLKPKNYFKY
ncbi:putative F-box/LRR-repeat protein [Cardamine amara subsp. amara]